MIVRKVLGYHPPAQTCPTRRHATEPGGFRMDRRTGLRKPKNPALRSISAGQGAEPVTNHSVRPPLYNKNARRKTKAYRFLAAVAAIAEGRIRTCSRRGHSQIWPEGYRAWARRRSQRDMRVFARLHRRLMRRVLIAVTRPGATQWRVSPVLELSWRRPGLVAGTLVDDTASRNLPRGPGVSARAPL